MGITRREFLAGALAFGAVQLIPSKVEAQFNPTDHVFVVGDLHLTRNDPAKKSDALISSLVSISNRSAGFHVIFNGDMLEFPNLAEMCDSGAWQWDQFAALYARLKTAGFIPHLVFGNHDGSEDFARRMLDGLVPPEHIGNSSFHLENGIRFILLSAMHPTDLDARFLHKELRKNAGNPAIVACHFPPDALTYIPGRAGRHYDFWSKAEILHALSDSHLPLVCSHSHAPFLGNYVSYALGGPIHFVSTPSLTYTLPYVGTDILPPRIFGITVLDSRNFLNGTEFFNADKSFMPPKETVESRKGRYRPLAPSPALRIFQR
ncbi:MAG: metallophosphoesterase [Candidatus ainarchaeum sp.]|nr:metallophosphoesterase [Candidatus ainarchaeum sp.]